MVKLQKTTLSLYKTVTTGVLALLALSTASLLVSFPYQIFFGPQPPYGLLADCVIQLIMPFAAFMLGYFAVKNNKRLPKLFSGSLALVFYYWLSLLLTGVNSIIDMFI